MRTLATSIISAFIKNNCAQFLGAQHINYLSIILLFEYNLPSPLYAKTSASSHELGLPVSIVP